MVHLNDRLRVRETFSHDDETLPAGAEYDVISVSPSRNTIEIIRVDEDAPVGEQSQVIKDFPEDDVENRFNFVLVE